MRKRHWLIGLCALLALAVGVGGGTALAQESGNGEDQSVRGLITRVADILGLDEQRVQDAFDQARQEMRDERFEEMVGQRLDALVESGQITEDQAEELRDWYAARPDSFWLAGDSVGGKRGEWDRRGTSSGRGHFSSKGQMGMMTGMTEESLTQYLDTLVGSGRITQEQADEIRERYAGQLNVIQKRGRFDRGGNHGWQRGNGSSFQNGLFNFRGYHQDKNELTPAMPTLTPGPATPTSTPTDSSDDN